MSRSSYEDGIAEDVIGRMTRARDEGADPWRCISKITYETGPDHSGDMSITFMIEFSAEPLPGRAELSRLEFRTKDDVWSRDEENRIEFVYFRYRLEGEAEADDTDGEGELPGDGDLRSAMG